MDNETIKEISKEIAKNAYNDVAKPVAKPTGELLGLVPRAIKAALSPLEKWIINKEYNIAEIKKLLEEKLKDTLPEQIQPPEPYIAVPALQYISYCMDNNELRNMYANLLANSMDSVVKNGVHPGFVEIIKQLSPDEAKILNYFSFNNTVPTISLRLMSNEKGYKTFLNNFSNIGELVKCEKPYDISIYFNNLIRLGLIESSTGFESLTNKALFEPLTANIYIKGIINELHIPQGYKKVDYSEGFMRLTDFGKAFCKICLDKNRTLLIVEKHIEKSCE